MTLANVSWMLFIVDLLLVLFCYRRRHLGLGILGTVTLLLFAISSHTGFLIIGTVLLCLLLGQPLFVLFGCISIGCLLFLIPRPQSVDVVTHLDVIVAKTMELASKEVLLAIPFFVVAGEVMTKGSLAERLIGVARAVFGKLPGGLAVAGVFGCVFFAAISGSSPVTVIAIGSIMVPAMIKQGYPERFAMGLISSAGSLGILIPPSIPMIIYAIVVGATTAMDPKELFLAGVMPGALIGIMLAGYAMFTGVREGITEKAKVDDDGQELSFVQDILQELKRGIWSLLLPAIILGGIYTGVFTTTEAAAVSVVYAFLVEVFIHGDLKLKDMVDVAEGAMTVMGSLFLIIALSIALNDVLVRLEVTDAMVNWLKSLDLTPTTFLILVNLVLLVVGCFMDIISAILIIAPMLAPMAKVMGIDPLHMGIIFIVNLEIGYLTPPLGLNLFVASTLFKKGLGDVIRSVLVPLGILLVGLMVITWVPVFSTGLPNLIAGRPVFGPEKKVEQKKTPEAKPPQKGLSIQELMKKRKQGAAGGGSDTVKKPMSIQELMKLKKQQKEGGADGTTSSADAPKVDKPMSIQELMKLKKEQAAAKEKAEAEAAAPKVDKPMSIQELMKLKKANEVKAEAPGSDAASNDAGTP